MDDSVCNFERQSGEEIKEHEPQKDVVPTAVPQYHASRGSVPFRRKQSGVYCTQVVETQDEKNEGEHILEENEAFYDELEVECLEALAMMTLAKHRRAEVNRARQFFRKHQSSEDSKARLDKLKQKLSCARCGQLGHWKDDNDCPANVKVLNWRKPR